MQQREARGTRLSVDTFEEALIGGRGADQGPSALHAAALQHAKLEALVQQRLMALKLEGKKQRGAADVSSSSSPPAPAPSAAAAAAAETQPSGKCGSLLHSLAQMDALAEVQLQSKLIGGILTGLIGRKSLGERRHSSEDLVSSEESDELELSSYCDDGEAGQDPIKAAFAAMHGAARGPHMRVVLSGAAARATAAREMVEDDRSVDGAGGAHNPHLFVEGRRSSSSGRGSGRAPKRVDRNRDFLLHDGRPLRIDVGNPAFAKPTLSRHQSSSSMNSMATSGSEMMRSASDSSIAGLLLSGGEGTAAAAAAGGGEPAVEGLLVDCEDEGTLEESMELGGESGDWPQRGAGRSATSSPFSQHSAFHNVRA